MIGSSAIREAEPFLGPVLRCIETDGDGVGLIVADDFLKRADLYRSGVLEVWKALETLLDDPDVCNADLKGMLNRIDIGWGVQSPFGTDARAAREYLEAARDALEKWARNA